jgi:NAD(P)-dependent dehydrogenase (short-subunit alcohol dehydrogenase family)
MDVVGKVVVVTGAARGIGRGLARCFARAGMKVVLAGINHESLGRTVNELEATGAQVLGVRTDVAKLGDVEALAEATMDRFGGVHVLCNNAGVAVPGPLGSVSMEDWRWTLSTNLWGPIHGVQVFLPLMEKQGEGHISATASENGLYAVGSLAAYNVSKYGVVGLMTSLERDLRARGSSVRASVLCPGAVATDITTSMRNRSPESIAQHHETEQTKRFWEMVTDNVAHGMDPLDVGSIVLDAIQHDRFWIFTHEHVAKTALRQAEVMASEQKLTDLA